MDIAVEEEEMLIVIAGMDLCHMQASAGRRRPRRPGFPNSSFREPKAIGEN